MVAAGGGKMDWGGGPSYGVVPGAGNRSGQGGGRDYSLLSPAMPRKGSVVTFDVGEPGQRRHSSPIQPTRRKHAVVSTTTSMVADCQQPLSSALKYCRDPPSPQRHQQPAIRYVDDYRTLTELRKRSAGDQSIISIRIDEDDYGEEEEGREECVRADDDDEEDDEDGVDERTSLKTKPAEQQKDAQKHGRCEGAAGEGRAPQDQLTRRRASLKQRHNDNTDDSDVERRMARMGRCAWPASESDVSWVHPWVGSENHALCGLGWVMIHLTVEMRH